MKKIKIFSALILLSLMIPSLSFVKAKEDSITSSTSKQEKETEGRKLGEKLSLIERPLLRASTTEKRLENRENNILRIKERLASTTASTSIKKIEKLNDQLEKQREQMNKHKERLLERETKVMEVLGKIASKIQTRIDILVIRGLDMTASKAKLALASAKIEELAVEGDNLATLIGTEITEVNKDQLFISIKATQNKIRTMAKETHGLLVDTIKEINKVLPQKNQKTGTSTATSTN